MRLLHQRARRGPPRCELPPSADEPAPPVCQAACAPWHRAGRVDWLHDSGRRAGEVHQRHSLASTPYGRLQGAGSGSSRGPGSSQSRVSTRSGSTGSAASQGWGPAPTPRNGGSGRNSPWTLNAYCCDCAGLRGLAKPNSRCVGFSVRTELRGRGPRRWKRSAGPSGDGMGP